MRYIDLEEIYNQTNYGLDVFAHFFPGIDFQNPKAFFKLRPGEKTASARVHPYKQYWRITDYGDPTIKGMKAVDFVKHHLGYSFQDALLYIEDVILKRQVNGSDFKTKQLRADYEMREVTPEDKEGEYSFVFKKKPADADLQAIGRYVTADVLKKYNCRVVKEYSLCKHSNKHKKVVVHIFRSTPDFPIFLFDYGDFKKLYKPYEQDKKYRFVYVGTKPKDVVFGMKQIIEAPSEFATDPDDEEAATPPRDKPNARVKDLFRCSGESDALNLASLGYHVYWLNSESAEISYTLYNEIDNLCENHYQILDLDYTGQQQALKNALKFFNLYSIELPTWLKDKNDWRGNPCKDLKDFINIAGSNSESTNFQFTVLKKNACRTKFWYKEVDKKRTTYHINMEFLYFFLKANGFYQMESIYHKKAGYCYVHIKDKVVDLIHPDNIKRIVKRYTKEWIKNENIMEGIALLNKINTSPQLSEANLETIEEIKLEFRNHDAQTEYIHFKNGPVRITPSEIKKVTWSDIPNYVLGSLEVNKNNISHVCPHTVRVTRQSPVEINPTPEFKELLERLEAAKTPQERENINAEIAQFEEIDRYEVIINDEDFIFVQFLQDLANIYWQKELYQKQPLTEVEIKEQKLALANMLFVIGYHCQQYKDPGKPWVTFLQDMKISEVGEASGRSGKSLLSKAASFVRASFYKGGRTLEDKNTYQFFYDGFTEFHDYIEVDDLAEYADINFFYTQITGKREVNPKNYAPFALEYADSGKMLISSNYELPNVNSSTIARMLNCGVSDYYHEATRYNEYKETRTPITKFGRRLYDDFTEEEWNKFYNLMAYCIQMNMRFYKIQPPMMNLMKRQARRTMTQGLGRDEIFLQWANDYFQTCKEEERPETTPALKIIPDGASEYEDFAYLNTYIVKDFAFENFTSRLSNRQKSDYRINKFKKHIQAWCDYFGYEFNPPSLCNTDNGRILKSVDGRTRECFYISTANVKNGNAPVPPVPPEPEQINEDKPPF